jgi:succinate dehydrogenase / fumarate reductase membrane anchor subunit
MIATGRSEIARLKALGSAKSGAEHWWRQRVTAVANLPLVIWFVVSAVSLSGASYEEVRAWLGGLFNATMMVLLVISVFWHARLGVQVVLEDYVHARGLRLAALVGLDFLVVALAVSCLLAILQVSLGS